VKREHKLRAKHPHQFLIVYRMWMLRPYKRRELLKLETPDSDEKEDDSHQEQETELGQNLGQTSVFCHDTVVAFEGMGMGGKLGEDAGKTL